MKVMMLGDLHGDADAAAEALYAAGDIPGLKHVVVAGDFGLWTHEASGHVFLDKVNAYATENELSVFVVGGNHENWDHWYTYMTMGPVYKGFHFVRSRILLAPKVNYWTWDHKVFLGVGGAVSIDRDNRLSMETTGKNLWGYKVPGTKKGYRTLWWPNEQLTDDELAEVTTGKVDYMISHDCSNKTPWAGRLKADPDSQAHRQKIDTALERAKPEWHFHGHMHDKYEWENPTGEYVDLGVNDHYTQTRGLECNQKAMYHDHKTPENWGILDTETDTFAWRSEL